MCNYSQKGDKRKFLNRKLKSLKKFCIFSGVRIKNEHFSNFKTKLKKKHEEKGKDHNRKKLGKYWLT